MPFLSERTTVDCEKPKPPPIVGPTRGETESSDSDNLPDDDEMTMIQSPVPTLSASEDLSSSEGSSQRPNRKRKSKEQEKRARKRRRDRESDRKAHELVANKLLRAFMTEQLETKKAAALKTSHLKDLTEEKAKLFRVLSTKDHNEKTKPRMNVDATALTSNRTLNSVDTD